MGPVRSYLNEQGLDMARFPLKPARLAEIIGLIDSGKVSHTAAAGTIFPEMLKDSSAQALQIAESLNLIQESGADALNEWVSKAMEAFPDKVEEYRNGKKGVMGLFMGEIMKLSGGKADPKAASTLLREKLEA